MQKTLSLSCFIDEATLLSTQDRFTIPFVIKRVFIIRDVKRGAVRGKHAHSHTKQALFCIKGSVVVRVDDGKSKHIFRLNKPDRGVFIDKLVWSEMRSFSKDAVLLVFASDYYREKDYIRDYQTFLRKIK